MHEALLVALTDVSYDPSKLPRSIHATSEDASSTSTATTTPATAATVTENNTLLAALGNSLLGLFASEHLSTTYPNLPTRPLQALTSRYVGPAACFAIAKDLGLGVSDGAYVSDGTLRGAVEGQGNAGRSRKRSSPSLGVPVRWIRAERDGPEEVVDAAATEQGDAAGETAHGKGKRRTTWEEVVARSVRSFVGLVYQEKVSIFRANISPGAELTYPYLRVGYRSRSTVCTCALPFATRRCHFAHQRSSTKTRTERGSQKTFGSSWCS